MTIKEKILKDVFKYTSARYISQGIGFFTAILLRRFLGPFYAGIWSLFKVFLGYFSYTVAPVNMGASYKIPFHAGAENREEEEEAKDVAFTFTLAVSVITSVALLVAAVALRNRFPLAVTVGLCVLATYLIFDRVCGYYMLVLRAKKNFSVMSRALVFDAVINLAFVMLLVRNFKVYGLYAMVLLVTVFNTLFIHYLARYKAALKFDWKKIKELFRFGFPIMIVGMGGWMLNSLDRIMIAKMLGVTFVGYYSIPLMAKGYIIELSSFGTVIRPWLVESYGKRENADDVKKFIVVPSLVIAYMLPLVLGSVFFIIPVLVTKVLPKFTPGILATQILLAGMFFQSCYPQAAHFLYTSGKRVKMLPIFAGAMLVNVAGNYYLIKMGYGIYGVATATSMVSFLCFIVIQSYAMRQFSGWKEIGVFLLKIIFPAAYTAGAILLCERYITVANVYAAVLVKICALFIFSAPLLFIVNKQTGIVRLIAKVVTNKVRGLIDKGKEAAAGYDIVFWGHGHNDIERFLPLMAHLKERGVRALLFYQSYDWKGELAPVQRKVIEKKGLEIMDYSRFFGKNVFFMLSSAAVWTFKNVVRNEYLYNKCRGLRFRLVQAKMTERFIKGLVGFLKPKINFFDNICLVRQAKYPYGSCLIKKVSDASGIRSLCICHGGTGHILEYDSSEREFDFDRFYIPNRYEAGRFAAKRTKPEAEVLTLGDPRFDRNWKKEMKALFSPEINRKLERMDLGDKLRLLYLCPNLEHIGEEEAKYTNLDGVVRLAKDLGAVLLIKPHPRYRGERKIRKIMKKRDFRDYYILDDDPLLCYADHVDFVISLTTSALQDILPEGKDKIVIFDDFSSSADLVNIFSDNFTTVETYEELLDCFTGKKREAVSRAARIGASEDIRAFCKKWVAGEKELDSVIPDIVDDVCNELNKVGP